MTLSAPRLADRRVLVTPTSYGKEDPQPRRLLEAAVGEVIYNPAGRPLKAAELGELIGGMDGLIAGLDEIDAAVIERADRLQVIARYGVGVDRVDLEAATRKGIVVTNTPGANSIAVAELTVGLMLALARQLVPASQATCSGGWPRISGVGLRGKTVGILGLGSIGKEVALRLAAFGCRLLAYDPYVNTETAASYQVTLAALDELLAGSDFVTLHLPVTAETNSLVNQAFLAQMKPGAFLVNTARGELVDELALAEAIQGGHLRGAALDCFAPEPPGLDNPLLHLEGVIATPHMASHTDEAVNQMGMMALEDCLAVLAGERPKHVVNPQVYGGGEAGNVHR